MKDKSNYSHQELAMLYFPHVQPQSASKQLTRCIRRDEELYADLCRAGFNKKQRSYTPLQTAIVFDHLGDPENWRIK